MNSTETLIVGFVIIVLLLIILRCRCLRIYRFYRPSCPFCVSSQEEWNKFKSMCTFKMICTEDINLDEKKYSGMEKIFNVSGVPTVIKCYHFGGFEKYDGERTADAYMNWAIK